MKIKLTADLALIEPLDHTRITTSGITLPPQLQAMEPEYGEVIAVGPGRMTESGRLIQAPAAVGDRVFYSVLNLRPFFYNGKNHFLIHGQEIMVIAMEDEERGKLLISEDRYHGKCPDHGDKCKLTQAVKDGRRGGHCPIGKKFFPEEELRGE